MTDNILHIAEFRKVLKAKTKSEFQNTIYDCWEGFPVDVNVSVEEIFGKGKIKWQKAFMDDLILLYRTGTIVDIIFLEDGVGFKKVEVPWIGRL